MKPAPVHCPRCGKESFVESAPRDEEGRAVCVYCPATVERKLEMSPELRALLARVQRKVQPLGRCGFEMAALSRVEAELDSVVPDAVLALLLSRGFPLARLLALTNDHDAYAKANFEGIALPPREHLIVWESDYEGSLCEIGYRPTKLRTEPEVVVWDMKHWVHWKEHPDKTLAALIQNRWADALGLDLSSKITQEEIDAFAPVIEIELPLIETPVRFVLHAKFGRGQVIRAIDEKLEIDFGPQGRKTLLSRFVTEA